MGATGACPTASLTRGVGATQDFHPRIHITDSDFASITHDGALCDATGQLGQAEFEEVIRRQARRITHTYI